MWVQASSAAQARELFALNAQPEARDERRYGVSVNDRHSPPVGVILVHGPTRTQTIAVTRR
jgi:hypothetical protein